MEIFNPEEIEHLGADKFLLDVRTPTEFEAGTIPNAINIELDELRNRLESLPKDKTIYLFCEVGLRGYLRSEEHTSELQSRPHLVCRLLLEKKKKNSKRVDIC